MPPWSWTVINNAGRAGINNAGRAGKFRTFDFEKAVICSGLSHVKNDAEAWPPMCACAVSAVSGTPQEGVPGFFVSNGFIAYDRQMIGNRYPGIARLDEKLLYLHAHLAKAMAFSTLCQQNSLVICMGVTPNGFTATIRF